MRKNQIYSIVFCLFLTPSFLLAEKELKREKRQIYYGDIKNKQKTFRSRAEEKEKANNEAEIAANEDVKPSLDPELIQNLLASEGIIPKTSPKGPSSSKGSFKPKPPRQESYYVGVKPQPAFEETSRPKPSTFGKPIRHKPKPAYEEPYNQNPFKDDLFPKRVNHGNYGLDNQFPLGQNFNHGGPRPSHKPKPKPHKEKIQNTIPGVAGKDYPIYHEVPKTSFTCEKVPFSPGMYANPEAGCQAYHICHDNRHGPQGASFLCTNGTVFNQESFNCDWWYNVDCNKAVSLYSLNSDPNFNPYYKKPAEELLYKSEGSIDGYKPKLATNFLQESQLSPTYSKVPEPRIPTYPDIRFFSSETVQPNRGSFSAPKIVQALVNPSSGQPGRPKLKRKVASRPKHFQTPLNPFSNDEVKPREIESETFSKPKLIQAPQNPFSFEAEIKHVERAEFPSGPRQSFEKEEKIEKSQEFVRNFEENSESINIERNTKIAPVPPPSSPQRRRVLRRRKRPGPSRPTSAQTSESFGQSFTRRIDTDESKPKAPEVAPVDIPEDAILDFEWGQRTT